MVQIIVEKNKIMLIDLIYEKYPYLPYSVICKTLRNKDVKVCGKRVNSNIEVLKGDIVQLYVDVDAYVKKSYAVLYENNYVLIVSKDQGVIVNNDSNSLIDLINKDYNVKTAFAQMEAHLAAIDADKINRSLRRAIVHKQPLAVVALYLRAHCSPSSLKSLPHIGQ